MEKVFIRDDFIKLEQAMKLGGACDMGSDAKFVIQNGEVKVNGETEQRRGKKLRDGDCFEYMGKSYQIVTNMIQ